MTSVRGQIKNLNIFLLIFVFILVNTSLAFAGPSRTTYQAKIVKPDGYPLEATNVNFKFTILDPGGSCILYSETYSSVNMSLTGGLISFALGSGVKTYPVSSTTFEQVFSNITPTLSCDAGGPPSYSPLVSDSRKIIMQFHDGAGWQTLPAMSINAVPYAMYTNEALRLNGKSDTDFVQVSTVPSCGVSEAIRYNGTSFSCVSLVGPALVSSTVISALGYTPADGASMTTVSANISSVSNSVSSLQGSMAASFAAITSSQWVTSGATISYSSGNVGVGTTAPVTKLEVSGGVRISMESATCAANYAGTLRYNAGNVEYCNGTSWQAFGVSGAGITNFNGSTSGTQTFATGIEGTAPAFNTLNGVHTLNIPLASAGSVTAGLLSNADYTTFTNKIASSAASIAQVLGYIPADNAASGTYAQKANNLSDLTNVATARTNLGLGTFATASSIDLGSASATGTLAIARLPSFIGDATIAAASNTIVLSNSGVTAGTYTKVTVDSKGRVTSSSVLVSSDVTTALGYTPASATASTQWTTSGSAIYYNTGNVGIGVTNPGQKFMVDGNAEVLAGNYFKLWSPDNTSNSLTFSATNSAASISQSSGPLYIHSLGFEWANDDKGGATSTITNSGETTRSLTLTTSNLKDIFIKPAANTLITNGNVGIGITAPTAKLHLTSGTTSVAPFKFTSGTLLTSPQSGTMEYDGVNFYLTDSTNTRRAIAANTNPGTYDNVSNINSSSNITLTPTGSVVVSSTAASTNSSTGALVVKGGLGVAGNLNVAGTISGSAKVMATGFRANQGSPDSNDSSTNGYAFGTDGDTGMFSPGSGAANGVLAFYGNNAELMRITASGAVGIGTSTPTAPIEAVKNFGASGAANSVLKLNARGTASSGFGGSIDFLSSNEIAQNDFMAARISSVWEVADNGFGLSFFTKNTGANGGATAERMRISNAGYVGVGTASPFSKMHIQRDGASASTYVAANSAAMIEDNDYALLDLATRSNGLAGVRFNTESDTTGAIFYFGSSHPTGERLSLLVSGTEKVSIFPNGNVGVGTATPVEKLHVNGTAVIGSIPNYTNGGSGLYLANEAGDAFNFFRIDGYANDLAIVASSLTGAASGTSISFRTSTAGQGVNGTTKMIIDSAGNVGIGTNVPTNKLEVNGESIAITGGSSTNMRFRNTNSAEGVFDIDYNGLVPTGGNTLVTPGRLIRLDNRPGQPAISFWTRAAGVNYPSSTEQSRLAITEAGNVGIGTATPTNKLDVVGSNNSGLRIKQGNQMSIAPASSTSFYNGVVLENGGTAHAFALGYTIGGYFGLNYFDGTSAYSNLWTITNGGNMGLGTTAPSNKLSVYGGRIETDNLLANQSAIQFSAAGVERSVLYRPAGSVDLRVWGTGLANDVMTWNTTNGNVGVGITSPTSKLDVNGQVAGKSYKTRLFQAGGRSSTSCTLSASNTTNLVDQFCDLSVTFTLTDPASVQINYTIAMTPGSTAGGKHLVTGIDIDGTVVTTVLTGISQQELMPYWSNSQTHFAELAAGSHTIKVRYRTPAGGTSNPSVNDWENRILQVMILGYQ